MKTYSEADMGSMKGYDPNLGLGKRGMKKLMNPTPKKIPNYKSKSVRTKIAKSAEKMFRH